MTGARSIEVGEIDLSVVSPRRPPTTQIPSTVNRSRLVGTCGTLVLHALAVSLLIPMTSTHKTKPPDSAQVVSSLAAPTPEDDLVLVEIRGPNAGSSPPVATHVDLRPQLAKLAIPLVMPDQTTAIDIADVNADADSSAKSNADPGDAEFRARMFGRYTGQISARIERAWEKPRSPVSDVSSARSAEAFDSEAFVCQVQIRQDDKGNVQEVLLLACNGTEAWRHSLVAAINQSSPLPAPPVAGVFQRALTMTFEGQGERRATLSEVAATERGGENP